MVSISQQNGETWINGRKVDMEPGTSREITVSGQKYLVALSTSGGVSCCSVG